MGRERLTTLTFAIVLASALQALTANHECQEVSAVPDRSLGLTVESKINSSGDWITFSSITDSRSSPEDIVVDVKHSVVKCSGKNIVKVYGSVRDKNRKFIESLKFSGKTGTNVAVFNEGRTAVKINPEDALNGVVFTNRPLKDDEIFEVVLEKKGARFDYSMGIGVTAIIDEILPHLNRVKSGTWMFYSVNVWKNGVKIKESYGENIYNLMVGDRVGVMRSGNGTLHLFVNGVDQGPGGSDVPGNLYGAFELFGSALQVSIAS